MNGRFDLLSCTCKVFAGSNYSFSQRKLVQSGSTFSRWYPSSNQGSIDFRWSEQKLMHRKNREGYIKQPVLTLSVKLVFTQYFGHGNGWMSSQTGRCIFSYFIRPERNKSLLLNVHKLYESYIHTYMSGSLYKYWWCHRNLHYDGMIFHNSPHTIVWWGDFVNDYCNVLVCTKLKCIFVVHRKLENVLSTVGYTQVVFHSGCLGYTITRIRKLWPLHPYLIHTLLVWIKIHYKKIIKY